MGWTFRGWNPAGNEIFLVVQTGPGGYLAYYTRGSRSFSGVKRPERGAYDPPPYRAQLLYLHSPPVLAQAFREVTFHSICFRCNNQGTAFGS